MPAKKLEFIYRHKSVARFQITGHPGEKPFDFKNNLMRISEYDEDATRTRNERFLDLVGQLHPRDRMQIVEVNPEAAARLERALGPRVSREALDTSMIRSGVKGADGQQMMSQAQIEALAEEQRKNDEAAALAAQDQEARDAAAIEDAKRLLAEGGAGDTDAERLKRVSEEEAKLLAAGQVDQTANQTTEEVVVDPAPAVPAAGLQPIKKK